MSLYNQSTQKTSYQQNLSKPTQKAPEMTAGQKAMETIAFVNQYNPTRASELYDYYQQKRTDSTSKYYDPYSSYTNKSVSTLESYGFDTRNLNSDWFNQNSSWIASNLTYNGTTNTPSKPGKRASLDQKIAYELYQWNKSEDATKRAEQQWAALQEEIAYWVQSPTLNLSDDQIMSKIDWSKYKELASMDDNTLAPNEYNRYIGYSKDAVKGVIWAARNGGGTGNSVLDTGYAYLGKGNQWQENTDTTAKLNWYDRSTYSPYEVGMTLGQEGLYFGVYEFGQKEIELLRNGRDPRTGLPLDTSDDTAMTMLANVLKAEDKTVKLEEKLDLLNKDVEDLLAMYDDPQTIIDILRDTSDSDYNYSDLFELDKTLEYPPNGSHSSQLVQTTRAINYRWADIEKKIRDRCAEKANAKGAGGVSQSVDEALGNEPTTSPQTVNKYPDSIKTVIAENGTETDKTVMETGSNLFDAAVSDLTSKTGDYEKAYGRTLESDISNQYMPATREIWNYESHQKSKDAAQAEIDRLNVEITKLEGKSTMAGISNIYPDEYSKLIGILGNEDWDYYKGILSDPKSAQADPYQQELYDNALLRLYQQVNGVADTTTDMDIIREKGEQYWDVLRKYEANKNPYEAAVEEAKRTGQNTVTMSVDDGGYHGEDEDTAYEISFIGASDNYGEPTFVMAVGNNTGEVIEDLDELMEKTDYVPMMTPEEAERYNLLSQRREELERTISEEDAFLIANEENYKDAKWQRDTIVQDVTRYSGDESVLPALDYLFQVSQEYTPRGYYAYNMYDYAVESGEMTKDEVMGYALQNVIYGSNEADMLRSLLRMSDQFGVNFSEQEKAKVQAHIKELEDDALSSGYVLLDEAKDFDKIASETEKKVVSGELDVNVGAMIKRAMNPGKTDAELGIEKAVKGMTTFGKIGNLLGALEDLQTGAALDENEMKRFYYLLGTDGEKAAQDYLNMLLDPESGIVQVRASVETSAAIQNIAKSSDMGALLATTASFVTNVYGGAEALAYYARQKASGEDVFAYNPAFRKMDITGAARAGTKEYINKVFGGEEKTGAKLVNMLYDGFTSMVDSRINAEMMSGFLQDISGIFSETKLGSWLSGEISNRAKDGKGFLNKLISNAANEEGLAGFAVKAGKDLTHAAGMGASAAISAYREVLINNGSEEQAMWMAIATFFAETGSEAITVGNIHEAIAKGGDAAHRGLKDLMLLFFKNGSEEFLGEGANEWIEQNADRIIMGALSNYEQSVKSYTDKGYPETLARQIADQQMWKDILRSGAIGFISSAYGTPSEYVQGARAEQIEQGLKKIEEIANVATSAYARTQAEQAQQLEKDLVILKNSMDADLNGSTVAITAALNTGVQGNAPAEKAAAQAFASNIANGDPKLASRAMYSILVAGQGGVDQKTILTYAALTKGQGNAALRACVEKVKNGEQLTTDDVIAIRTGLTNDKSDPSFFATYNEAVKASRVANRAMEIMEEKGDAEKLEAEQKKVAANQAALETRQEELKTAENERDAANEGFNEAFDQSMEESSNDDHNGALQQSLGHLDGTDSKVIEDAEKNVAVAKENHENAKKDKKNAEQKAYTEAQQQAKVEVEQEMAQEEEARKQANEEAYKAAVAQNKPMREFGELVEIEDDNGHAVKLTGVYDQTEDGWVFNTADGGLIKITRDLVNDMNTNPQMKKAMNKYENGTKKQSTKPAVYFPRSLAVNVNGQPVQMVGIAGKTTVDRYTDPVIMDINGNLYSVGDPNVEFGDVNDDIQDVFEPVLDSLPEVQEPSYIETEEITEPDVTEEVENDTQGSNGEGLESEESASIPVQGDVAEGNNIRELPPASGRDGGLGDNSNAESGTGQEELGRSPESQTEYNGQEESRRNERLRDIINERLQEGQNANDPGLQVESDYGRFSNALNNAKANNPYGTYVDAQTPEDLEAMGAICLLSPDGMTGVAIATKGDNAGNILAVFNNANGTVKHTMPYIMTHAIMNGGKKLDAFDGFLSQAYERYGFVPVAKVRFNREYAPEGWNYDRDGEPYVIMWMHNGDSADTVARRYNFSEAEGGYHHYTDEEIENLPEIGDYDEALAYRDRLQNIFDRGSDLVITHNLSVGNAIAALNQGGIAGPSVAITRQGQDSGVFNFGETGFGENTKKPVVILLNEGSIDPQADARNAVYGDDAYTESFPRDSVEYRDNKFFDKDTGEEIGLEDVLRLMTSMSESAQKRYGTLADMKKDSGRLVPNRSKALDYSRPLGIVDDASTKLYESLSQEDQERFGDADSFGDAVNELLNLIYTQGMTAAQMKERLASLSLGVSPSQATSEENGLGVEVSDAAAADFLESLERAVGELVDYFEAKLRRVVSSDEFQGFVIPEGETELENMLKERNIPYLTYKGDSPYQEVSALRKALNEIRDYQTELDAEGEPVIRPQETEDDSDIQALRSPNRPTRTMTPTERESQNAKAKYSPATIAKRLADRLGIGGYIPSSKFGDVDAEAFFDRHSESVVLRSKNAGDFVKTIHEFGHFFAKRFGLTPTEEMMDNFRRIDPSFFDGSRGYKPSQIPGEAIAEFMWRYMEGEEQGRAFAGDEFYDSFEEIIRGTDEGEAIAEAREQLQMWLSADVNEKMGAQIVNRSDKTRTPLRQLIMEGIASVVDSTAPAQNFDNTINGIAKVKQNVFNRVRDMARWANTAGKQSTSILMGAGLTDANGNIIGKSLADMIADTGFRATGNNLDLLNRYMLAKHSLDRDKQNKPVFDEHITKEEREAWIKKMDQEHPEVGKAAKAFQDFRMQFLQEFLVNTGRLSQEAFDKMNEIYPNYVPTFRVKPTDAIAQRTGKGKTYKIQRAKGSTENIYNPFDSFCSMVNTIVAQNALNRAGLAFDRMYHEYEGLGMFAHEVPKNAKVKATMPIDMTTKQAQVYDLVEGMVDGDTMSELMRIVGGSGFTQENVESHNTLKVVRPDGSVAEYEFEDMELFKLLAGVNNKSTDAILNAFGFFTRGMSALTTGSNPVFAVRNFLRDFQNSVNYGSWASNYGTGVFKWLASAYEVWRGSNDYNDYVALGGGGWTQIDPSRVASRNELYSGIFKGYNTSNLGRTAKWAGKKLWNGITFARLNEIVEQASRFAEYKFGQHNLKTQEGRVEGYLAAQEATVDFNRSGNSHVAVTLKKFVPFFNASMQGVYRTGRMFTEAERDRLPARFFKTVINTALTSAICSAFLKGSMDDDDKREFEMLSDDLKSKHFYLPNFAPDILGDAPLIRIPLAQDPLTYAIHGLVTNTLWNGDTEDGLMIDLAATVDTIMDNLNPLGSGTILEPILGVAMNRSWYGNRIVPARLERNKFAPDQYTEDTPDFFVTGSRWLHESIGLSMSPMKLQYLFEQYTGYVGQLAIPAISKDSHGNKGGWRATINAARKKFTSDPLTSNEVIGSFYDGSDIINSVIEEVNQGKPLNILRRGLTQEEAAQAYEEAKNLSSGLLSTTSKKISEIYNRIDQINDNPNLTDKEKYKQTSDYRRDIIDLALTANEAIGAYKEKYVTGSSLMSRMLTEGSASYKPTKQDKLPDAFKADENEDYMVMAREIYNATQSDAALPHPDQTITITNRGKVSDDYQISDEDWPRYVDEYKRAYKKHMDSSTRRWDTLNTDKKKSILSSAHSKGNEAMRKLYAREHPDINLNTTGKFGKGNIDLNNRKVVQNDDGSISTEQSFSFYDEESGKEVLIPTVINGRIVSEEEAIEHYYRTGEYLGMFNTPEEANRYAEQLHERQEWYYNR